MAMRVAKNWNKVVSSSPLVHDARIIVSINQKRPADFLTDPSSLKPVYDADSRIHYFELGGFRSNVTGPQGNEQLHTIMLGQKSSSAALGNPKIVAKYVTRPPCQTLLVRSMYENIQHSVYVKNGVRVQHLKEAADDIWDRHREGRPKIPPIVVVQFETATLLDSISPTIGASGEIYQTVLYGPRREGYTLYP